MTNNKRKLTDSEVTSDQSGQALTSNNKRVKNIVSPITINSESGSPSPSCRNVIYKENLSHYNLDYSDDINQYLKEIYDPNSKWFSRSIKSKFDPKEHLPYKTETHKDQARYFYHIIINLYIAISSLDIQGLISISEKDLINIKQGIEEFPSNYNSNNDSSDDASMLSDKDISNFDEGEDEEDQFDENEYIEFTGPDFNAVGKITAELRSIINVNHWTNELKNCLDFNFPISLRKSLVIVYYHLSMVQGQKIYRQLHVEVLEMLTNSDDKGTNFTELLKKEGLVLEYNCLFQFLCEFLPYPDSDYVRYDIGSKDDLNLFRLLLKLAHMSKVFFDENNPTVLKDSMNFLLSSIAPTTLPIVLPIITSFVPYHYNDSGKSIIDYLPFCFSIWGSTSANIAIDTHMYDFVGNILEDAHIRILKQKNIKCLNFTEYGLFTKEQLIFLFNRLQGHLRTNGQIHSYSRTVRPFIYSINGSSTQFFFEYLSNLANSIETFVHPSNSGFWTKPIAKFVHSFIKMYHGRVKIEEKLAKDNKIDSSIMLNDECHSKLSDIFLNVLFIGAQNKNPDIANFYISCFAYIVDLNPNGAVQPLDKILVELYESLSDEYINSRHRIIASLKQFSRVVRYLINDDLYRVHVTNILFTLISKLDMNDINLTSNLINGIVSIASFIPLECPVKENEYLTFESNTLPFVQQHFYHLKSGESSETFKYNKDDLNSVFRASTTVLQTSIKIYIEKLFSLVDIELDDGFITKVNQTTMILIQSMDDSMFKYFAEQFEKLFWVNDAFNENNPNYEIITVGLSAIVKRDKSYSKGIFTNLILNIKRQIERGAGSVRSNTEIQKRDHKLVLYLTTLNDTLRQFHESALTFGDELIEGMLFIFDSITNPPLDVITSILVHSICSSLTSTEVVESQLFSAECALPFSDKWGALQFDDRKYNKENLNFKWHVPQKEEIELAIQIFTKITDHCITMVEELLENPQSDTNYKDKIQKYILIITHALTGCSLLFDSDYNKLTEKKYINKQRSNLLAINKTILNMSSGVYTDDDEADNDVGPDLATVESEINVHSHVTVPTNQLIAELEDGMPVTDSEIPSRIQTPEITISNDQEEQSMIGMEANVSTQFASGNGDQVFKDLDIFACNYYFGNDPSVKLKNVSYHSVNKQRLKIGLFYHKIFKFLSTNYENNVNIFQALLHGLKVWFTDVGQETIFNDDPNANLEYDFLENIQSLRHLDEPYTRTLFSVKANNLHQNRVLLHSSIRFASKLENQLLNDIIRLSCSVYPDIHKPAQGSLLHSMTQIIGSYSIVINGLIKALRESMNAQSNMQIEVVLRVLSLRKIQRKLLSDFSHLEDIIVLLIDCYKINELDISILSEKILTDLVGGVKIPSSICVYDEKIYTSIAPLDENILNRVESIKIAKTKKRNHYLSLLTKVQDNLLSILNNSDNLNWKIPMFIVTFLSKLQSSLEIPTTNLSIETIFNQTKEKHPQIIHLVVRSYLSIFNKVLSLSDYEYDISRAYQSSYDPAFVFEIDTSKSANFKDDFRKEMNNFENPNYFIDGKAYVGWLCWGRTMKVVKTTQIETNLREHETDLMNSFGELVSVEWLKSITTCLIQDNETRCVFSSGDVSFFVLIIILISKSYTKNLKLQDLFDLCEKYYDRYDKASMIMSIEIFASLICGTKYMNEEEVRLRDEFVDRFLKDCLNHELNQDAFEIWGTLCWWLPSVVDIRRCLPFYRNFSDIKTLMNTESDEVGSQASKIIMFSSILMGLDFRSPYVDEIIEKLVLDHRYDQVRESIGRLLSILTQNGSTASYKDFNELMEVESQDFNGLGTVIRPVSKDIDTLIVQQFNIVKTESMKITNLTPQEILKTPYYYISSTMFYWLQDLIRSANKITLVPYVVKFILPFLFHLMNQKDVCKLGGIDATTDFLAISYLPMRKDQIEDVITFFCSSSKEKLSTSTSYECKLKLAFIQHFISSQLLQLTREQKVSILNFIVEQIYNAEFVEVRIRAADVLSDIVHNIKDTTELNQLIDQFSANLDNYTWEQKKQLSNVDVKIHGSVIALGAIISAFPYVFPLPRWIPEQLSKLSSWARTSGVSGRSAKDTISEFKKVRADTWNFDRSQFTTDELEDLEGVLWRSYYA